MQGISKGTRSGLLFEALRIIKLKKPKYLLAENVKNLVSKRFIGDFNSLLDELDSLGYNNYWKVANALDSGIPQKRERVFVVSIRKDIDSGFSFRDKRENSLILDDILSDTVDDKYCLDIDSLPEGFIEHLGDSLKVREATKKGYAIATYGDTVNLDHPKSKTRRGRIGKQSAGTLTTGCNQGTLCRATNKLRRLSPNECWRLMGFSDEDFNKAADTGLSDSQLYKQAGNSIVVNVLEDIFGAMFQDYMPNQR